jgi:hypothetical protein
MSNSDNLDEMIGFVERPDSELYSLKIKVGPFKDVIYTYGKVDISEDAENDRAKVSFDWRLEDYPKHLTKEEIEESEEFKNYIGNILTTLIEEKSKNDKPANTDTQESNG